MLPVDRFLTYIQQHALFSPADPLLLAVSGGKDSVLMAHLFKQAGFNFSIAHCNFNLRGDESQRDETFVRLLAAQLDVPVFVNQFDTKTHAGKNKLSTQMAARELRYTWFEALRVQEKCTFIALAHHQNDVIETILLNLVRGTGISGLHGILPKHGNLIRPMLFLNATEIEQIVTENEIAYVEDSSNLTTDYSRNKIRLNVVPHLREINPSLEQTFEQNIERFAETEIVLQQAVANLRATICRETDQGTRISINGIKNIVPQKLMLFELLRPYNFSSVLVNELLEALDKQSGTSFYSTSHRATIDRDELLISPLQEPVNEVVLWHPNESELKFKGSQLRMTLTGQLPWQFNPAHAYVDHAQLVYPLVVRNWQQGDSFIPLGMSAFKKLSDFFIDSKVPLPAKQNVPILINGNSQIVWIGGYRQDERYKVSASTKKVAIFELDK